MRVKKYRPNAAVIVTDGQGNVLLCERVHPAGAIQTVQGGIDSGETAEEAAKREVREELGLRPDEFQIINHLLKPYRYDWAPENKPKDTPYDGQEQLFFLAKVEPNVAFHLDAHDQEFSRVWWGTPEEMIKKCWDIKRPGIQAALEAFF